jgi:pimeloyl-ACP methyl ester carboxylesterase
MWQKQVESLQHRYRCVVIDWPGQGTSSQPAERCTIADMAAAVREVIDTEGWGSVHLVGFSMGGMAALTLAAGSGAPVRSLTLIGTSADREPRVLLKYLYEPMLAMIRRWGWDLMPCVCVHLFYSLRYIWFTTPGTYSAIKRMIVECGPLRDAALAEAVVRREGLTDLQLESIRVPTVVMRGRWDLVRRFGESRRLASRIPHAERRVHTSWRSGHGVCAEDPDFVLEHLLRAIELGEKAAVSTLRGAAPS